MTEGRRASETPCAMLCILPPIQHAPSRFATKENESQVKWLATGHTADARCCRRAVPHSYNRIFLFVHSSCEQKVPDICLIASSKGELTPEWRHLFLLWDSRRVLVIQDLRENKVGRENYEN